MLSPPQIRFWLFVCLSSLFAQNIPLAKGWSLPVSTGIRTIGGHTHDVAIRKPLPQLGLKTRSIRLDRIPLSNLHASNSNARKTSVHLVVPTLNEEKIIRNTLETLTVFLASKTSWEWTITVVDNGCTDNTRKIAQDFAAKQSAGRVAVIHVPEPGRGNALREAWMRSSAAVQCYCDADLSSDLQSLAMAVEHVAGGRCDIAVASRVAPGSEVVGRSLLRDITSYGYILLLRLCFMRAKLSDCQCGCKALSSQAAAALLPLVEDKGWFFDTEMLLLAVGSGLTVREVPVKWQDDRDSRVRVWSTILGMLKGIWRLKIAGWRNRLPPMTRAATET